jgi:F420-non-reducing hydrogenase small subunit
MNKKLNIAFYWAASYGGCEIAVSDINEKIFEAVQVANIVFLPITLCVKYKDVEAMPDKNIDITFFNCSIRNSEQEHMAKLLRQKSKIIIAFGSCVHEGSIPGLANLYTRDGISNAVYIGCKSNDNPNAIKPQIEITAKEGTLKLPSFYNTVKTLAQTIPVDYYLPGCPPSTKFINDVIDAVAKGQLPPNGTILAPLKADCDECPHKRDNRAQIYRIHEKAPEPERCLMEQGIICVVMATRSGCGAQCLKVDMPCTGCGGATPNQPEVGAGMITVLASILHPEKEQTNDADLERLISQVKDHLGTFYMYSLPALILKRKIINNKE